MISHYRLTSNGIEKTVRSGTWISVTDITIDEKEQLANNLDLPLEALEAHTLPELMPHVNVFQTYKGKDVTAVTLIHYTKQASDQVENDLIPVTFLLMEEKIITMTRSAEDQIKNLMDGKIKEALSSERFLLHYLLRLYGNYIGVLQQQKQKIDRIYTHAKDSTDRKLLIELTDIEQNLVYLEQTLGDQNEVLQMMLKHKGFSSLVGDNDLKNTASSEEPVEHNLERNEWNKVIVRIETALKMVHLYRELMNSTSGLISDMMDSKLNNIMEQLQTIALILTVPTMIFSLWGINTGGLIGRGQPWGSVAVVGLAIILGILTWVWLDKKQF